MILLKTRILIDKTKSKTDEEIRERLIEFVFLDIFEFVAILARVILVP